MSSRIEVVSPVSAVAVGRWSRSWPRCGMHLVQKAAARSDGVIGIELPSGIKVSVDATVDADALSRAIGVLAR